MILGSIGVILFASGWVIGAVGGFGEGSGQASTSNQKPADSDTQEQEFGMAGAERGQRGYGVESIVVDIARAAYEQDIEVLERYASPGLKEHYGSQNSFKEGVRTSLESAPELRPGPVEVLDAAPLDLFGKIVFYRVALKDKAGGVHKIGIVFKEPAESEPVELSYCYIFVENERLGESNEASGLWRDLLGNVAWVRFSIRHELMLSFLTQSS